MKLQSLFYLLVFGCTLAIEPLEALWSIGQHTASLGPQIYQLRRVREGGSKQKGILYGLRGCIERTEPNAFYWGAEVDWAKGELKGTTASGNPLRSNMTETWVEGRAGWTFEGEWLSYFSITPFIGVGYYEAVNHFRPPTVTSVRFTDSFGFYSYGFQSKFWTNDMFSIGFNLKAQNMYEGKDVVSNDPDNPSIAMRIEDQRHWVVEFPLNCYPDPDVFGQAVEVSLTPFYQYRHFGGREGIFDFIDTKFYVLGARLTLGTSF